MAEKGQLYDYRAELEQQLTAIAEIMDPYMPSVVDVWFDDAKQHLEGLAPKGATIAVAGIAMMGAMGAGEQAAAAQTTSPAHVVTVDPGQTEAGIGASYGLTWQVVEADNSHNVPNPKDMQPDTRLLVTAEQCPPGKTLAQLGDTVSGTYHVPPKVFQANNNNQNANLIFAGECYDFSSTVETPATPPPSAIHTVTTSPKEIYIPPGGTLIGALKAAGLPTDVNTITAFRQADHIANTHDMQPGYYADPTTSAETPPSPPAASPALAPEGTAVKEPSGATLWALAGQEAAIDKTTRQAAEAQILGLNHGQDPLMHGQTIILPPNMVNHSAPVPIPHEVPATPPPQPEPAPKPVASAPPAPVHQSAPRAETAAPAPTPAPAPPAAPATPDTYINPASETVAPAPYGLDSSVLTKAGISEAQLAYALSQEHGGSMADLAQGFYDGEGSSGVNMLYEAAAAAEESEWQTSDFAVNRNNDFGIAAYTSDPNAATHFGSQKDGLDAFLQLLRNNYLVPGEQYYAGPTLHDIYVNYSTSHDGEATTIASIMNTLYQLAQQAPKPAPPPPPAPVTPPTTVAPPASPPSGNEASTSAAAPQANQGDQQDQAASVVWPFATKDPSQYRRVDQGWDLQTTAAGLIYAVAPGVVEQYNPNPGGFGDDYPTENLDTSIGGPTNNVYYGHVHVLPGLDGKHVKAGEAIAVSNTTDVQNGSNAYPGWLEIGFAQPGTDAPVNSGIGPTAAGESMKQILLPTQPAPQPETPAPSSNNQG